MSQIIPKTHALIIKPQKNINRNTFDIQQSLKSYMNIQPQSIVSLFLNQSVAKPEKRQLKQTSNHKRNLVDWRQKSQNKNRKTNFQKENQLFEQKNQYNWTKSKKSARSSFSYNKMDSQKLSNPTKSGFNLSKISLREKSDIKTKLFIYKEKDNFEKDSRTQMSDLTPSALIQNIYQSSVMNNDTTRVQTARIRSYYKKKSSNIKQFNLYDKITRFNNQNTQRQQPRLSYHLLKRQNKRLSLVENKRLSLAENQQKCLLKMQELKKYQNKIKISSKSIMKQYKIK